MIKRFLIIFLLCIIVFHPQLLQAENHQEFIEIFDSHQEKVVKTVQVDDQINKMVKNWLNEINQVYQSINPIPNNGYAIRFPIISYIDIENKWLNKDIEEVYLTIPNNEDPCLIVLTVDKQVNFFEFPGDLTELSDLLDFKFY